MLNVIRGCCSCNRFSISDTSDELCPILPPYLDVSDIKHFICSFIDDPNIHLSYWAHLVYLSVSPVQKIEIAVFVETLLSIFKVPLFLINKLRFNICRVFEDAVF